MKIPDDTKPGFYWANYGDRWCPAQVWRNPRGLLRIAALSGPRLPQDLVEIGARLVPPSDGLVAAETKLRAALKALAESSENIIHFEYDGGPSFEETLTDAQELLKSLEEKTT